MLVGETVFSSFCSHSIQAAMCTHTLTRRLSQVLVGINILVGVADSTTSSYQIWRNAWLPTMWLSSCQLLAYRPARELEFNVSSLVVVPMLSCSRTLASVEPDLVEAGTAALPAVPAR